jgi:20S proteasome alpha/beta subunit
MAMDKVMKMFAPNGRIYQLEYAFKAAQSFG